MGTRTSVELGSVLPKAETAFLQESLAAACTGRAATKRGTQSQGIREGQSGRQGYGSEISSQKLSSQNCLWHPAHPSAHCDTPTPPQHLV